MNFRATSPRRTSPANPVYGVLRRRPAIYRRSISFTDDLPCRLISGVIRPEMNFRATSPRRMQSG